MSSDTVLQEFGFSFAAGGPHLARTMMLPDLESLLEDGRIENSREQFCSAIEDENVLGKPSAQSRKLAFRHLAKLYALDQSVPLYSAFSFLWKRDPESRPLLALLVAYVRDSVLRSSAPFIFDLQPNAPFDREALEQYIDGLWPGRFSPATLKSTAQNIAGTWTQSGHLVGRSKKRRQTAKPGPGAISLALLISHIQDDRGILLFESEFVKLLDCSPIPAIELAETASRKGWIKVKRIGKVVDVDFPRLTPMPKQEATDQMGLFDE